MVEIDSSEAISGRGGHELSPPRRVRDASTLPQGEGGRVQEMPEFALYSGNTNRGSAGSWRNLIAGPICALPSPSRSSIARAFAFASPKPSLSERTGAQHR